MSVETHPIKYLLLNKNELSYEVLIRGEEPASTVLKLRNQINKLTVTTPADDIQESGIDGETDFNGSVQSLKEFVSRIKILQEKFDPNLFERAKALGNHIYYRLNRIDKSEPDVTDKVTRLQREFNNHLSLLIKLSPAHSSCVSLSEQPNLTDSAEAGTSLTTEPTNCDRYHIIDLQKLKFNGKSCVHVFIQRVSEFCTSRNISHKKLLTYATEIFTDNALHWFRSVKNEVRTWEELTKLLIADFGQFDYDYRLMSEIRDRTQGDTENIVIYLAIMAELFARLSKPISEAEKLDIILHNIKPCYSNILVAHGSTIDSINTLRTLARNYERIQAMSAQFRGPPKATKETLAPDLAYKSETLQVSGNFNTRHVSAVGNSQSNERRRYCPRCRSDSHSLHQCKQQRFIICFKCGKRDVKYPDCKTCHPNSSQSKN